MEKDNNNGLLIKLKAYKILAEIRSRMLSRLESEARTKLQYSKNDPESLIQFIESIGYPDKWEYYGTLSKEDKEVMETIEYLLKEEPSTQFFRRKSPTKY